MVGSIIYRPPQQVNLPTRFNRAYERAERFISWVEDEWDGEVLHSNPAPQGSRWDWIVSFKYNEDYGGYLDEPLEMTGEAYFLETPDALFRIDWETGDESYTETCKRIAESFTLY